MINHLKLLLLGCIAALNSNGQSTIESAWLNQYDNTDPSKFSYELKDIVVDSEGNPILAFNVTQEVDFGGGYIYDKDYFTIVKMDTLNNIIWEKEMMSDQLQAHQATAEFGGMDIDENDNLYINAYFDIYIAPGMNFDTIFVEGQGELLGKLNANGDAIWATVHENGFGRNLSYADGFIYCIGEHGENVNVGPNTAIMDTSPAIVESYIYKVDTSGNYYWLREIDSLATANEIKVFSDQIYLTGQHAANTVFPGGNNALLNNYGNYVLNIDTSGSFQWVNEYSMGAFTQSIQRIDDKIYIAGNCSFTTPFGPFSAGFADAQNFVLALDIFGNEQWLHSFAAAGFIDIANYSNQLMVMARSNGESTISSATSTPTAFIALLDANGNVSNYVEKPGFYGHEIFATSNAAYFSGVNPGELWLGSHYLQGEGHVCGRLDQADYLNLKEERIFFKVFPNPAQNHLQLQLDDDLIYEINIYNEIGQLVFKSHPAKTIDISSLSNGQYFIEMKTNQVSITEKLVISR